MGKLLKTDRSVRLKKVASVERRKRTLSPKFSFVISRRRSENGLDATVNARLSYMGRTTGPFSTGITAQWEEIDKDHFEIKGQPDKSVILADMRTRAEKLFADCRLTGRPVDVFAIRDALFAQDVLVALTPSVQQLVDNWLAYDQQRFDTNEIVQRTLWKNKRWTNDFWAFVNQKYGKYARLTDLKAADIRALVLWLKQTRNLSNNVAQATASHAKVIMNYALDNEWVERNPFVTFRRKMDDVNREMLEEDEIRLLCTFPLAVKTLEAVRDVFFFMCLTGLSYADVKRLRQKDIRTSPKGEKYIHLFRQKMLSRESRVPAIIPLTNSALDLLARYQTATEDEPLLPLQANAPFNRSLKQIAFMCGLQKSITTKVARNSLATYLINHGVPLSSVSAMLGHSSTTTTQKFYAKVSPNRVIEDMSELNNRLDGNGLFGIE